MLLSLIPNAGFGDSGETRYRYPAMSAAAMKAPFDKYRLGLCFHFLWHDSGDIQSVAHLRSIVEVCERTPGVKHWLPTRELADVASFLRRGGVIPSNLVVRVSATMVDAAPDLPRALQHLPTSTVHTGHNPVAGKGSVTSRAVELRGNRCGPCRACWDPRVTNVSYPAH